MEPCSVWEGSNLLEIFLRNDAKEHVPRPTRNALARKEGTVMTIQADEMLPAVFMKLTDEGFLGAPVCRGSELVGHVSLLDLVKYVNGLFFATSEEDWQEFWQKKLFFGTTTVESIINSPNEYMRCPFPVVNHSTTSFTALEMMARSKVHQVLLLNDDNKLCGMLTTSMLISFMRQNKRKWGTDFMDMKVFDFEDRRFKKSLQTIEENELAINAFLKMENEEVQGLPIVDQNGVLTGCISIRDLRGVGTDGSKFFRLYRTIKSYKELCALDYPRVAPPTHYSTKRLPADAVFVTPESTMADVVGKMEDGNLHRVFICSQSSANKGRPVPIGVVSQTDVLYQTLLHMLKLSGSASVARQAPARLAPRKVSPGQPRSAGVGMGATEKGYESKSSPSSRQSPARRSIPISFE